MPQHTLPLKTASKLFHFSVSVSLLPNEEGTVPSGNLLVCFKCDGGSEVSKVILFLQALWKINGLVEKEGLLWKIQKCLDISHTKLAGKQTLVIPVFEAVYLSWASPFISSAAFLGFFFPFLLRGSVEKMLLTLTKILSKQMWFFCFGTCILWLKNKLKNFWNRIEFLWYSCRLREIGLSQYSTNWSNSCILKSTHAKLISFNQILCAGFTVVIDGQFSLIRICMFLITLLIKLFDNSFIERRKIILVSESYVTLKVTG